jgi:hypothetical protein
MPLETEISGFRDEQSAYRAQVGEGAKDKGLAAPRLNYLREWLLSILDEESRPRVCVVEELLVGPQFRARQEGK